MIESVYCKADVTCWYKDKGGKVDTYVDRKFNINGRGMDPGGWVFDETVPGFLRVRHKTMQKWSRVPWSNIANVIDADDVIADAPAPTKGAPRVLA